MLKILVPQDSYVTSQYVARYVVSEFIKNKNMEIHILDAQAPFSGHVAQYTSKPARKSFHLNQAEKALAPAGQLLDRFSIPYYLHTEIGKKADCNAAAVSQIRCDRAVISSVRKRSLVRMSRMSVKSQVIEGMALPAELAAGARSQARKDLVFRWATGRAPLFWQWWSIDQALCHRGGANSALTSPAFDCELVISINGGLSAWPQAVEPTPVDLQAKACLLNFSASFPS